MSADLLLMSLFSRLDRLRTRDAQAESADEQGLFAVPELTPSQSPNSVPPPHGAAPIAQDLGIGEAASVTFAPVSIGERDEYASPRRAVPGDDAPRFAPVSLDIAAAESAPDEEDDGGSMFAAAPFRVPDLNVTSDEDDETPTEGTMRATVFAPQTSVAPSSVAQTSVAQTSVAPASVAPTSLAPAEKPAAKSASPFERLMAARAAQTQTPAAPAKTESLKSSIEDEVFQVETPADETPATQAFENETPATPAFEDEAAPAPVEDEAVEAGLTSIAPPAPDTQVPEAEPISSDAAEADETATGEEPADQGKPAPAKLSLADRLARAPREALEEAHAEAESLTPEVLADAPSARATPLSHPAPEVSPQDQSRTNVMASPAPAPREAAEEAPARPRSFSERLAARTTLDSHLQVPAETPATSQQIAPSHTELARIDEGIELSEREMKNRLLYRQKHLIFDSVLGSLDPRALQNPTREALKPAIERGVDGAIREFNLEMDGFERNWMVDEFVRETTDLGPLVPLLEDPAVSKIVVTGANDVSVERLGRVERSGVSFRDDDHLLGLVRRMAEMSGGRVDAKVPLLDRPLPDGARIRAKVPPLAPLPTLTIEKSTGNPFVALKRQQAERARDESLPYAQLRERIQQKLLREFEGNAAALAGDQDKLRAQVEEMIGAVIAEERVAVSRAERASLVMDLLHEIVGLGPIEPLLNDPDVDEVMVNGPYQIYVERKGKLELSGQRFRDNAHVMQVIDRIVAPLGRRVDEKSPMVDGRLRDGSRFNAIIPPLALSGPTMTIRKFARDPFTMSDLINFGSMTREAAQFLQAAVEGRLNIVVSGGTGSGKTTTLNVLSSFIPSSERIVTIEDAAELQMRQEHVIRMETRPPNIEGVGEVGIRDLVRNSLRMRPDRIVVGECRGGEALDMLQAMNTGHDGSLTTAHSNGPRDTLKRLETMVMMAGFDLPIKAIREQIAMAVQLIVHQERMRDGKRRVTAITEIVGMEGDVVTMQDIFRFEQDRIDEDGKIHGMLAATGMRPKHYETIIDNGATLSMELFQPRPYEEGRGRGGR